MKKLLVVGLLFVFQLNYTSNEQHSVLITRKHCNISSAGLHNVIEKPLDNNEIPLALHIEDFPYLEEGFRLCGRNDLQDFFNQKIAEFNNKINLHNDEEAIRGMVVFDQLTYAIIPAQEFIVTTFSQNKISAHKFCSILNKIINNDPIVYDGSIFTFLYDSKLHHITDPFFQYCIHHDFMNPVMQKYINDYIQNQERGLFGDLIIEDKAELAVKLNLKQLGVCDLAIRATRNNNAEIINLFISKGLLKPCPQLLFYAIKHNAFEVAPLLGSDIKVKDGDGNNPLHHAIKYNSDKFISNFIAIDEYVHDLNTYGNSPLHILAAGGNYNYLPDLIAAGYNINQQNNKKETPLHILAENKYGISDQHCGCCYVRPYGTGGTEIGFSEECCLTTLYRQFKQKAAISVLIAHGADLNILNNKGERPWDIAVSEEIRNVLIAPSPAKNSLLFSYLNSLCNLNSSAQQEFKDVEA